MSRFLFQIARPGITICSLLVILLSICTLKSKAQEAEKLTIDQLWNLGTTKLREQLKLKQTDSAKFKILIAIAQRLEEKAGSLKKDLDSAYFYLGQAGLVSKRMKIPGWEVHLYKTLGAVSFSAGDVERGKSYYFKAIAVCRSAGDRINEARLWVGLASKFDWAHSAEKLKFNQHARQIYKSLNETILEAIVLKEIADIHFNLDQVDLAEHELQQVLSMYKSANYQKLHYTYDLLSAVSRRKGDIDKTLYYAIAAVQSAQATADTVNSISVFYWRLGEAYQDAGNKPKSIEFYEKSYQNALIHGSALLYHVIGELTVLLIESHQVNKALQIINNAYKRQPPVDAHDQAALAFTIGDCYLALKNYKAAERSYTKYINSIGDGDDYQGFLIKICQFYISQNNYAKADFYQKKLLQYGNERWAPTRRRDVYLLSFKIDSAIGKPWEAISYLQSYNKLNDSIFTADKFKLAEELQVKFKTSEKEKDNQLLRNRNAMKDKMLQNENLVKNIIIGGCVVLFIILLLLYNRYQIKQNANGELLKQQEVITSKNHTLENIIGQKTRLVSEKEFLLKEIHHRVKNNLQLTMSLLNSQSSYLTNEDAVKAIEESQHRLKSISLVHQKLYQTDDVDKIDLKSYIGDIISYLRDSFSTGRRVHFETQIAQVDLDISQAVSLGLFINEAITNIFKYAFNDLQAGIVQVSIQRIVDNEFRVLIRDNGHGLPDSLDIDSNKSLGMTLMKGLSMQLGGTFQIYNDKGTTVCMDFFIEPSIDISLKLAAEISRA